MHHTRSAGLHDKSKMVFIIIYRISKFINSQHSVVNIVTTLLDECPENLGLIPGKSRDFPF